MEHVSLVVVAHSHALASGAADVARQMTSGRVVVEAVGGRDGRLGCEADDVSAAIQRADKGRGVVVFADLGSSLLATQAALPELAHLEVVLADAPLVEGLITAAVVASTGAALAAVVAAGEGAWDQHKL